MCGAECESVVHVLWECSSYSACRDNFQEAFKQLLGARYAEFETLSAVEKTSYVLGSKNCIGGRLQCFAAFSERVHRSRMGSAKIKTIR